MHHAIDFTFPVVLAITAAGGVHAECWKLPSGQVVTTGANSTAPMKGAQRVTCPQSTPAPSKAAAQNFPRPQSTFVSPSPLGLLVHYLDKSGTTKRVRLRDFQHDPADLSQSRELRALASHPCSRGDNVRIASQFPGRATGQDAAGIGRFTWRLDGTFVSDGLTWSLSGNLYSGNDLYNFDPQPLGSRTFFGEVSTRIGSLLPGKPFKVQIDGAKQVKLSGPCRPGSAGSAIA